MSETYDFTCDLPRTVTAATSVITLSSASGALGLGGLPVDPRDTGEYGATSASDADLGWAQVQIGWLSMMAHARLLLGG